MFKRRSNESLGSPPSPHCAKCGFVIRDAYYLLANDLFWHEDCLRCCCCNTRLAEVAIRFYVRGSIFLCQRDYLRIFGESGTCSSCLKNIFPFEYVIRAKKLTYHLECFNCEVCGFRFCVGDKFILLNKVVLCEKHSNLNTD